MNMLKSIGKIYNPSLDKQRVSQEDCGEPLIMWERGGKKVPSLTSVSGVSRAWCCEMMHCLSRNLTLRSSRITLSADYYHLFNQPIPAQFSLAKKIGSLYNAFEGSGSW